MFSGNSEAMWPSSPIPRIARSRIGIEAVLAVLSFEVWLGLPKAVRSISNPFLAMTSGETLPMKGNCCRVSMRRG